MKNTKMEETPCRFAQIAGMNTKRALPFAQIAAQNWSPDDRPKRRAALKKKNSGSQIAFAFVCPKTAYC
ncbi:MAG: hypothetical protein VB082_06425 [Christensenella sp.]|nr:hypothetical protein [Christensenella sp.]